MPLPRHSSNKSNLQKAPTSRLLSVNDPANANAEYAAVEQANDTVEPGMSAGETLRKSTPVENIHCVVQHLPPELLEEIFRYFQEEHEDLFLNRPPWHLLHICQLWRQVALRMPKLWRHLPPIVHYPTSKRIDISKLRFLLQHSSTSKITFLLYQTHHLVPNGVLTLLTRHCRQWERVAFYVSDYVCEFLSRSTLGRLPSLTTLTIDIQSLKRPHNLFTDAPKLRTFRCTGSVNRPVDQPFPSTLLSGHLSWKLTSFTSYAAFLDTQTLLKILARSKKLEKLDVALRGPVDPLAGHQIAETTLPACTSLALSFPPGPQIHQSILSKLTIPSLTELYLGLYPPPRLLDDLAGMITRSTCPLQHLTLQSYIRHLRWNITDILSLTPQLKSLSISSMVDERLVETLGSWSQGQGWALVPFLETLTIHTETPCNIGQLAVARCDLVGGSGLQVCQRLDSFFVVTSSPLDVLEDLRGIQIPAGLKCLLECLDSACWLLSSNSNRKRNIVDTTENFSIHHDVDALFSFAKGITDAEEILYLYYTRINIRLWRFFSSVPLKLRLALGLRTRFEDLFTVWANVVVDSSSNIRWIWDRHGYLKYVRDTAEGRAFLFFRLKRCFLEEDMPVYRNFPYNEDKRPVKTLV